jgi:hypothetical protein
MFQRHGVVTRSRVARLIEEALTGRFEEGIGADRNAQQKTPPFLTGGEGRWSNAAKNRLRLRLRDEGDGDGGDVSSQKPELQTPPTVMLLQ